MCIVGVGAHSSLLCICLLTILWKGVQRLRSDLFFLFMHLKSLLIYLTVRQGVHSYSVAAVHWQLTGSVSLLMIKVFGGISLAAEQNNIT